MGKYNFHILWGKKSIRSVAKDWENFCKNGHQTWNNKTTLCTPMIVILLEPISDMHTSLHKMWHRKLGPNGKTGKQVIGPSDFLSRNYLFWCAYFIFHEAFYTGQPSFRGREGFKWDSFYEWDINTACTKQSFEKLWPDSEGPEKNRYLNVQTTLRPKKWQTRHH